MITVHRHVCVYSMKCVCVVSVAPQLSSHWGLGTDVLLSPLKPTCADAWLFSARLPGPHPTLSHSHQGPSLAWETLHKAENWASLWSQWFPKLAVVEWGQVEANTR